MNIDSESAFRIADITKIKTTEPEDETKESFTEEDILMNVQENDTEENILLNTQDDNSEV
ncbi:MAG: hypothetical protein LUF92_12985 [Clostridiales bacterium]|nr:hypothetical protein [Clostridiales bacterium]